MERVKAWHFTDGMKLRDGQELVVGRLRRTGNGWFDLVKSSAPRLLPRYLPSDSSRFLAADALSLVGYFSSSSL